jgi:hypothetical protein
MPSQERQEYDKNYYLKNKDKKLKYQKEYYKNNQEKFKQYRINNEEKINASMLCICGSAIRKDSKKKHLNTQKHKNFIENHKKIN